MLSPFLACRGRTGGLLAGAIVLLAGCGTPPPSRVGPPPAAPAGASATPELEAHARYFGGRLEAEVLLGRGQFAPRPENSEDRRGERGRGGPPSGGLAGGGRRGGGGPGSPERGGEGPRSRPDGQPAPALRASNAPPVQFRLRLTNHDPAALEVEVTDFNSALGNFVVLPRKIVLPPGGSIEAEPMTSRLGLATEELALTVAIRSPAGTERQVLTLQPRRTSSPAARPTPASPVTP